MLQAGPGALQACKGHRQLSSCVCLPRHQKTCNASLNAQRSCNTMVSCAKVASKGMLLGFLGATDDLAKCKKAYVRKVSLSL